jgi:hypothetical protein
MSAPVGTFCDLCVVPCVPVCVLSCSWLYLYVDTVIALGEHSKHSIVQQPRDSQYGVGVCPRVYQCVLPPPPLVPPCRQLERHLPRDLLAAAGLLAETPQCSVRGGVRGGGD